MHAYDADGNMSPLHSDILQILKLAYLNDINLSSVLSSGAFDQKQAVTQSKPNLKRPVTDDIVVGFSDITVWFFKSNSQQSLDEAKRIWNLLPQNQIERQKLDLFLSTYTWQIIDKHKKFSLLSKKHSKILKLVMRTEKFLTLIERIFPNEKTPSLVSSSRLPAALKNESGLDDEAVENTNNKPGKKNRSIEGAYNTSPNNSVKSNGYPSNSSNNIYPIHGINNNGMSSNSGSSSGMAVLKEFLDKKFAFHILIDEVCNVDFREILNDSDYIGHHIEIGYKETCSFTPTERMNNLAGKGLSYRKSLLTVPLKYKTGNIFINLYQDSLKESQIDKKLVASRNFDVFTAFNLPFLQKRFALRKNQEDSIEKIRSPAEKTEVEGNSNIILRENIFDYSRLNNNQNLLDNKDFSMEASSFGSLNPNNEVLPEIGDFEVVNLNKKGTIDLVEFDKKDSYVKMKIFVWTDDIKNEGDIKFYREVLKARREYLKSRGEKVAQKKGLYKKKLQLLLLPFQGLSFDEKKMIIKEEISQETKIKRKCDIF